MVHTHGGIRAGRASLGGAHPRIGSIARGLEADIALFVPRCHVDKRVSSIGSIDTRRDVEQISLILVKFLNLLLIWDYRVLFKKSPA